MINGNESDVRNIDFELQTKRVDKFLCFIIVFKPQRIVCITATRFPIEMGFGSKL